MALMKDVLLIDKPSGWTSFDVVAKLRGAIRAAYASKGQKPTKRQLKVGHTGTLDPFATGLIVILLGEACSMADKFLKLDKVYEAEIKLGENSSTGDPEGEITKVNERIPSSDEVRQACEKFVGKIEQTPPMFSAIKIGGRRAYEMARKGQTVEMPKRAVTVLSLKVVSYNYPILAVRAHVSSGTYIRSLASDIGDALGTGAYCKTLRRVSIGLDYDIADALDIDEALQAVNNRYDSK